MKSIGCQSELIMSSKGNQSGTKSEIRIEGNRRRYTWPRIDRLSHNIHCDAGIEQSINRIGNIGFPRLGFYLRPRAGSVEIGWGGATHPKSGDDTWEGRMFRWL